LRMLPYRGLRRDGRWHEASGDTCQEPAPVDAAGHEAVCQLENV